MRGAWSRSSSGKWKEQMGIKLWQVLTGTFATAVLIGSVWVVIGSVWFPEWWYPVIWNGEILDWDYLLGDWRGLLSTKWHSGSPLASAFCLSFSRILSGLDSATG